MSCCDASCHRYPITPKILGAGTIIGLERTITKVSGVYCGGTCNNTEPLVATVYDREGFLVRTERSVGQLALELDMGGGQIAVVTHAS